jgi:hypothetical protein
MAIDLSFLKSRDAKFKNRLHSCRRASFSVEHSDGRVRGAKAACLRGGRLWRDFRLLFPYPPLDAKMHIPTSERRR